MSQVALHHIGRKIPSTPHNFVSIQARPLHDKEVKINIAPFE